MSATGQSGLSFFVWDPPSSISSFIFGSQSNELEVIESITHAEAEETLAALHSPWTGFFALNGENEMQGITLRRSWGTGPGGKAPIMKRAFA